MTCSRRRPASSGPSSTSSTARPKRGRIDLGEVRRLPVPRAGGSGILLLLGDAVSLTWRDLAVLMMSQSDNEATNLLIDRLAWMP